MVKNRCKNKKSDQKIPEKLPDDFVTQSYSENTRQLQLLADNNPDVGLDTVQYANLLELS